MTDTTKSGATNSNGRTQRIAHLNDAFRSNIIALTLAGRVEAAKCGRLLMTRSIGDLDTVDQIAIINAVRRFAFTGEDAHSRHDYGAFDHRGERYCWKIDCYDARSDFTRGSDDPADPSITTRVLTIMRADED